MSGEQVVHMVPQADRVPKLMAGLFNWLKTTEAHPLIASCVFHYELEFIHPFSDGNGRMGRLWQTLILSQWHPMFKFVPVESLIHKNQQDYYQAIRQSTAQTDSEPFIAFMLNIILKAINDGVNKGVNDGVKSDKKDLKIMKLITQKPTITKDELAKALDLSKSTIERRMRNLKKQGKIKRTGSDKTGSWIVINN